MTHINMDDIYEAGRFARFQRKGQLLDISKYDAYHTEVISRKSARPSTKYWTGKRVLITGTDGMVGSTIADQLIAVGAIIHGTVKRHSVTHHPNIQRNIDAGLFTVHEGDLCDYNRTANIIKSVEPHAIFHQAAESFVPTSLEQPSFVVENNCVSTTNVLEAATKLDKSIEGIQVACSSEQYGFVSKGDVFPIKETNELRPTSTYAVTKVCTEYLAKAYYHMYKTPTVITRSFNQEGPRRSPHFFTSRIAMQIVDIINSKSDSVVMGNPNAVRDFTHIHDSARAQILAVEKCNRGEAYNICSGIGITTGDYARLAIRLSGIGQHHKLMVNKSLIRPYERGETLFDGFVGNNSKFCDKTGWKPVRSIGHIITDSVDYFEKAVK
jgi:GDP-4-dehydro-6-deoxy-D-mannose reductase